MSDMRTEPRLTTGPDECERLVWNTYDLVERMRRYSPALARQAARAALEAATEIHELNKPLHHPERNAA